jgi:SAM-dependent methyltransferase
VVVWDDAWVSDVFGEVAELYDDVRPDHPTEITDLVLSYAARDIASAVEIGAGTGKATALFAGLGFPITCIEPDPRMAGRLATRFPEVTVVSTTFEEWTPPPGGVDVLYGAMVWHWLAPATRAPLAARALRPGGTLAIVGRRTNHENDELDEQIMAAFRSVGPDPGERPPIAEWALPELRACPELTDLTTRQMHHAYAMSTARYLRMMQTFSPFRMRPPEQQRELLAAVGRAIDAHGGTIGVRLDTTLILARKVSG